MRVCITGATGFIGRHLAARYARREDTQPIALVRRRWEDPVDGCDVVLAPDFDAAAVERSLVAMRPDVLVHLAAAGVRPDDRDLDRLVAVNAAWPATLVRLAAAAGVRTVVMAGSSAEYAPATGQLPLGEDAPLESRKLYGATKAAGGLVALAAGQAEKVDTTVLRLFNVYGAGEAPHRLLPSIVDAARDSRPIALSAGTQVRDFVEVGEACRVIEAVVDAMRAGTMDAGVYNVASGRPHRVSDFARAVVRALDADPALLEFGRLPMRPDDLPWLVGDPARLERAIGWVPSGDLGAGIARALESISAVSRPS